MFESVEMLFSQLNPQAERLRIVHLSDPHIHHPAAARRLHLDKLVSRQTDLVLLTGDYMVRGGAIEPAMNWLTRVTGSLRPRLGFYGIFGNHDEPALREQAATLPIHWLDEDVHVLPDVGLAIGGFSTPCGRVHHRQDLSDLIVRIGRLRRNGTITPAMMSIMLAHVPGAAAYVEALGIDWLVSGHTHGGQVRLPNGWSPADLGLPTRYHAGLFRLRDLVMTVSRGMGGRPWMPRVFCPRQVPVYTLHRGSTPGARCGALTCVKPW